MLVTVLQVIGLIVIMLPLWWIHEMGIPGLGHPENGFFVPTTLGYIVGTALVWLAWFAIFIIVGPKRPKNENGVLHG